MNQEIQSTFIGHKHNRNTESNNEEINISNINNTNQNLTKFKNSIQLINKDIKKLNTFYINHFIKNQTVIINQILIILFNYNNENINNIKQILSHISLNKDEQFIKQNKITFITNNKEITKDINTNFVIESHNDINIVELVNILTKYKWEGIKKYIVFYSERDIDYIYLDNQKGIFNNKENIRLVHDINKFEEEITLLGKDTSFNKGEIIKYYIEYINNQNNDTIQHDEENELMLRLEENYFDKMDDGLEEINNNLLFERILPLEKDFQLIINDETEHNEEEEKEDSIEMAEESNEIEEKENENESNENKEIIQIEESKENKDDNSIDEENNNKSKHSETNSNNEENNNLSNSSENAQPLPKQKHNITQNLLITLTFPYRNFIPDYPSYLSIPYDTSYSGTFHAICYSFHYDPPSFPAITEPFNITFNSFNTSIKISNHIYHLTPSNNLSICMYDYKLNRKLIGTTPKEFQMINNNLSYFTYQKLPFYIIKPYLDSFNFRMKTKNQNTLSLNTWDIYEIEHYNCKYLMCQNIIENLIQLYTDDLYEAFAHFIFVLSGCQFIIGNVKEYNGIICDFEFMESKIHYNKVLSFILGHKCSKYCEMLNIGKEGKYMYDNNTGNIFVENINNNFYENTVLCNNEFSICILCNNIIPKQNDNEPKCSECIMKMNNSIQKVYCNNCKQIFEYPLYYYTSSKINPPLLCCNNSTI